MACIDSAYQAGFEQYHDHMVFRRGSIQRMSNPTAAILRTAQEVKLVNVPVYEKQPDHAWTKQLSRQSFVKRCSQIATGRRPTIQPSHIQVSDTSSQDPSLVSWVQRLPSQRAEYDEFLETALEEAVGQLVCGPNAAAEEADLGYNYDKLEDVAPEAWVRVQAQLVESKGTAWIAASISSKAGPNERSEVYAYGKWILAKTKRHH